MNQSTQLSLSLLRRKTNLRATHSTAFLESHQPKITLKGRGGLSKEVVQKEAKAKNKPVTVVSLDAENYNTVPKSKKKLRAENSLNFCNFLPADTVEDVNTKICSIFPSELLTGQTLVFLQSTQSGDLFNAALGSKEFSPDGETVIKLAGTGSLNVSTCATAPTRRSASPVTVIV